MKKRIECGYPQYEDIKKLFNQDRPSVNLFERRLASLPKERQEEYYRKAFFLFMNAYPEIHAHYRYFLTLLVKQKPDRFLDYLFSVSGVGKLRCGMADTESLIQVFHLLTAKKGNVDSSFFHLALCIRLGFDTCLKTATLADYIRKYRFYPETFYELAEYAKIYE